MFKHTPFVKYFIFTGLFMIGQLKSLAQNMNTNYEKATLAAGCFWCVEAIYQQLNGVINVESGFSGGHVPNPSYNAVCRGETGHAEVCQLTYDSNIISFQEILEVFFKTHNPTTLNRQGNDVGEHYRSAIFYHNKEQEIIASSIISTLNDVQIFSDPIVTEVSPFNTFYPAGDYHKDYFELNGEQPYCNLVIKPKVDKFKKAFQEKLKK